MVGRTDGADGNRPWHDGGVRTLRLLLLSVGLALSIPATGLATSVPTLAPAPAAMSASTPPPPGTDNPFIPEDVNLGDCVSALPRPGCGSEARGGQGQWLVFGALVLGLGFIGWRVVRSARRSRPTPDA
jgi:hypothetical protein